MKVYEKIRSLRKAKNWSQEEMAKRLNMSVNGYSKIERGETNAHIPRLEQIAKVFKVELTELIPRDEKNVYLFRNSEGDDCQILNLSIVELAFEIEKLNLIISHKDEIITQQKQEIADLKKCCK